MALTFDFGSNWQAFSADRLDAERVRAAQQSIHALIGEAKLNDRSFLDVGCGSGLFTIAAASCGARPARGFDVNDTAVATSVHNAQRFLGSDSDQPEFRAGSILDSEFVRGLGEHDTVYAWGSLHHTGAMWQAIRNAAGLVSPGGTLVLAIYNAHWSAPIWKLIKRVYNLSPRFLQKLMVASLGSVMYVGVWLVAGQNPMKKERGMDFWYDVVDWLGGYPYEVASPAQIRDFLEPLGFRQTYVSTPRVPTGCNEFVFRRS
jgi:2-polyprenyl-6-hydroxyphenyl methylase/3-demethylubiquinone-9 3-methyltransferase